MQSSRDCTGCILQQSWVFPVFFFFPVDLPILRLESLAAIAGLLSAVLQPVLAGYADQPQSPSLKKLIQMLYFLQLILVIGLFLSHSLILTGLLYGSSIALLQLMTPFINSLGMESINQGHSLNFGLARGWDLSLMPVSVTFWGH